jgi:hypothetical protein
MESYSPIDKEELFNLRHASARNVIERMFGVLKERFTILQLAPGYNKEIQARIPVALGAIQNFICQYDPDELATFEGFDPCSGPNVEELAEGPITQLQSDRGSAKRDEIASAMWEQYQQEQD